MGPREAASDSPTTADGSAADARWKWRGRSSEGFQLCIGQIFPLAVLAVAYRQPEGKKDLVIRVSRRGKASSWYPSSPEQSLVRADDATVNFPWNVNPSSRARHELALIGILFSQRHDGSGPRADPVARDLDHQQGVFPMKFGMNAIAGLGLVTGIGLLTLTAANAAPQAAATSGSNVATTQSANSDNMANANMASQDQGKMSPRTTTQVQRFLAGDGQKVKIDGVWGPSTEAALKSYQKQDGLTVTGQLDQATRAQMNLRS